MPLPPPVVQEEEKVPISQIRRHKLDHEHCERVRLFSPCVSPPIMMILQSQNVLKMRLVAALRMPLSQKKLRHAGTSAKKFLGVKI